MYSVLKKFVRNPVCIVIDEKEWARSTSGDFWHGYYDVRSDVRPPPLLKSVFFLLTNVYTGVETGFLESFVSISHASLCQRKVPGTVPQSSGRDPHSKRPEKGWSSRF